MNFLEKLKDRYTVITIVLVILISTLSFRLATLTIAQGDYYRNLSDNRRVKEVYTTAPRGEIRDRYGRLLAGNKPSFTVQLFKDEINLYSREEKNEAFLTLVRLLEEDGVNYIDDFPIDLNTIKYKSEKDYQEESLSPMDKVIELVLENNLLGEVLNSYYLYEGYDEHFKFMTVNKAVNALKRKGMDVPIDGSFENGKPQIKFKENKNIKQWKESEGLAADDSPIKALIKLIDKDKAIIRQTIDNPIARKLTYEILKSKNLADNLILEEFSITHMEQYLDQKRSLNKLYPEVTLETSAEEDFVNIFTRSSLKNFLQVSFTIEEEGKEKVIIPAQILIDMLKEKKVEVPLKVEVAEGGNVVFYYTDAKAREEEDLVELLIEYGKENSILADFITSETIRSLAQEQLLTDGINPRISIAQDIEYVAINNLNKFYTENKLDHDLTVEEIFNKLIKNYEVDENLSKYEARGIFGLYNQLKKQGYLAYQPINIAYGIKETTVAKIEEGLMEFSGIDVSIEPVRYYPEGTTAAHILGYLGKISQPNEIQKYIGEKNYSPGTIIGKTGIEESFEDQLSGEHGIKRIEVDSVGNTTSVISEIKPVPGDNLYLSIDLDLQKKAEEVLEHSLTEIQKGGTYKSPWGDYKYSINRSKRRPYKYATSGAVVAVDVKTGQVLASASFPAYDPNLFATGITDSDWLSLFPENEDDLLAPRPLYNIATQTALEPGSIFKMATALTALEKGLSPDKKIRDMGYVNVGKQMNCLLWTMSRRTHGNVNVYEALRDSCNYYFYSLALGQNQRTGESIGTKIEIEDIVDMVRKLGMDDKTGIEINIPAERSGGAPEPYRKIQRDKSMLRNHLKLIIDDAFKEDFEYDEDYKTEVIEEILSWMELEEELSRGEVIRRLESLGIDAEKKLPSEGRGLADIIKFDYLRFAGWNMLETLNVTIGQGMGSYTPIQMANYIATIANGGNRHKLTLIDNIKNYNNSETVHKHEPQAEKIQLNDYDNLEHIKKGMLMVTKEGTASAVFRNFPVEVGSKTGTAQREGINPITKEKYDEFSWFVGFAPYDDPEIAVATVIFQGGSGSHGGPIVRDIIAEYLGLNKTGREENLPYENTISQ